MRPLRDSGVLWACWGDGAFKQYAWACLQAQRPGGELSFDSADVVLTPTLVGRVLPDYSVMAEGLVGHIERNMLS